MAFTPEPPAAKPGHSWKTIIPKRKYVMAGTYREIEYDGEAYQQCTECGERNFRLPAPAGPCPGHPPKARP